MDNKEQKFTPEELAKIRAELQGTLVSLSQDSGENIEDLKEMTSSNYSDPHDRATMESDRNLNLRIRERETKLAAKIKKTIKRIDNNSYQTCEECGGFIAKARLIARSVTDLCINCKEAEEQGERLSSAD